jgi:hypothetical protein
MDKRPNPNAPFAVLRVDKRKAKAMGAIAAASAHHLRQRPTPNANPSGPAPIILHLAGGTTPYQAASHLLEDAERRNRDTVLCREVVLSASPSYFRPGREHIGGAFDPDKTKAWARIALAWAKRQWPDQLASAVLHLDEQTGHIHLLVVPRIAKPEGGWKLNSKALFDRSRLRELQTAYGEAVAPLGIQRGLPGSMTTHTTIRQFYGAAMKADKPPPRPKAPPAPKAPPPPEGKINRLLMPLAHAFGIETEFDKQQRIYAAAKRRWLQQMKEHRAKEDAAWASQHTHQSMQPIRQRSEPSVKSPQKTTPASAYKARPKGLGCP